jgi:hypothetical protein
MKTKQIAEVFAVSPAWARRIKQRRRETGEITPRPVGGRRRWKIDRVRLAELVVKHPDATRSTASDIADTRYRKSEDALSRGDRPEFELFLQGIRLWKPEKRLLLSVKPYKGGHRSRA